MTAERRRVTISIGSQDKRYRKERSQDIPHVVIIVEGDGSS